MAPLGVQRGNWLEEQISEFFIFCPHSILGTRGFPTFEVWSGMARWITYMHII